MQVIQSNYASGITGFADQQVVAANPEAYEECKSTLLARLAESDFPVTVAAIKACPPAPGDANHVTLRELRKRIAGCFFIKIDELVRLFEQSPIKTPFVNVAILQERGSLNLAQAIVQLIACKEHEFAHEMIRKMASIETAPSPIVDRLYLYLASWYARQGDYEETRAVLQERVCSDERGLSRQALGGRIVSYVVKNKLDEDTETIDSELVGSLLLNPEIVPYLDERVQGTFQRHAERGPRTCGRMLQMIPTRSERIEAALRLKRVLSQEAYAKLHPFISLEIPCSPQSEQVWEILALPDDRVRTFLGNRYPQT